MKDGKSPKQLQFLCWKLISKYSMVHLVYFSNVAFMHHIKISHMKSRIPRSFASMHTEVLLNHIQLMFN